MKRRLLLALFAWSLTPVLAFAHHGWSEYDAGQMLTLTGTIEEAGYEHPHGYVKLKTPTKTWIAVLAPTFSASRDSPRLFMRDGNGRRLSESQ